NHHCGGLADEVRDTREQVGETLLLVRQSPGERRPDGAVLGTDQQVDVGNFVAFAGQRFTDEHGHGTTSVDTRCRNANEAMGTNIAAPTGKAMKKAERQRRSEKKL